MVLNKNVIFLELLVPPTLLRIVLSSSTLSKNLYLVREMKPQYYPELGCYFRCAVTAELWETLGNMKGISECLR